MNRWRAAVVRHGTGPLRNFLGAVPRITDQTRAQVRARVANASTVTIDPDADGNGSYATGVNRL